MCRCSGGRLIIPTSQPHLSPAWVLQFHHRIGLSPGLRLLEREAVSADTRAAPATMRARSSPKDPVAAHPHQGATRPSAGKRADGYPGQPREPVLTAGGFDFRENLQCASGRTSKPESDQCIADSIYRAADIGNLQDVRYQDMETR